MTADTFLALALFATVTLFTPGPNNLMLMASGANFGLHRSLPHMAGVAYGFPAMVVPVGLGVMQVFDLWPPAYTILKGASILYILWLAWKIANAAPPQDAAAEARPLTFLQAAAFQWLNPKAWSMALGAVTLYAVTRETGAILAIAGTFAAFGTLSALVWTTLGVRARRLLSNRRRLRIFNATMAVLLVASMLPVLTG